MESTRKRMKSQHYQNNHTRRTNHEQMNPITWIVSFHKDLEFQIYLQEKNAEHWSFSTFTVFTLFTVWRNHCFRSAILKRFLFVGPPMRKGACTFPLGALAYTRSGDKGNNSNIGKHMIFFTCKTISESSNPANLSFLRFFWMLHWGRCSETSS